MDKRYFADIFFYTCPKCRREVLGKHYYFIYQLAEMGAAKRSGLIQYQCSHEDCNATYPSDRIMTNGEAVEVSRDEALANGLVFESRGQA